MPESRQQEDPTLCPVVQDPVAGEGERLAAALRTLADALLGGPPRADAGRSVSQR
ncbi:hypothetical protein [Streptacidiphilus carbonis]|uniref:hypothetical protein n=1 Tax=Streptacidiphilus carbonis TaxID=105422 RepID=UPI000A9FD194|nr:hypothetical protein [Streptacidiphilus carbonis]